MNRRVLISLAVLVAFGVACETAGKRTAIGAGAGGAAGAGVGYAVGGKKGALIGLGVGALAGGSVGLYLDKQAKELEAVAETKRTENGILVNMKNDILFDTGKSDLKSEAITQLTQVGDIVAKYGDDRVRIEGHTDSDGTNEYNQGLSERRADAVRQVLVARGVKAEQISVVGRGEGSPIASNDTSDGKAKNRRVELHIDVPNPT